MKVKFNKFLQNLRLYIFITIILFIITFTIAFFADINEIQLYGSIYYGWNDLNKQIYTIYMGIMGLIFVVFGALGTRFYLKKKYAWAFILTVIPFIIIFLSKYININLEG